LRSASSSAELPCQASEAHVEQVLDAEHERDARGEQEQHQPELQAVQRLLEDQDSGHRPKV